MAPPSHTPVRVNDLSNLSHCRMCSDTNKSNICEHIVINSLSHKLKRNTGIKIKCNMNILGEYNWTVKTPLHTFLSISLSIQYWAGSIMKDNKARNKYLFSYGIVYSKTQYDKRGMMRHETVRTAGPGCLCFLPWASPSLGSCSRGSFLQNSGPGLVSFHRLGSRRTCYH